jgi:hypothetical protein
MNIVPFRLDHVYGGLGECSGLARDEGSHLCLEYQIKDGLVGVLKGKVKQVRIALTSLTTVEIRSGWFGFGTRIVIQSAEMAALADFPRMSQGRIELHVARRDRAAARQFVDGLHTTDAPAG